MQAFYGAKAVPKQTGEKRLIRLPHERGEGRLEISPVGDGVHAGDTVGQDHKTEEAKHRTVRRREGAGFAIFRPPEQSAPGPVQLPEKGLGEAAFPFIGGLGSQKG